MTTTIKLVIVAAVVLFLFGNSYYTIQEEEQAVVCTFGAPKAVTTPGLHFKIPFIQTVTKVNTTIQGFTIGYAMEEENTTMADAEDAMMITSDYNFINVDFYAAYRVTDPVKALYASEDPVEILKNIAQNCIRTTIGSYTVDSVLTTGKNEIQANITQMILEKLETYDIGIQLINITIQDAEPPTEEVSNAFKEVETAKQGKETALNNANKYRNEKIPDAEAKSDEILQDAEAAKQERINEANGQVARFNSMYEEYVKYPEVTKKRMFYEAMENVLPDIKVVIEGADGTTSTVLPLDSFVSGGNSSVNDNAQQENNDTEEE
ncbi:MAG: FtsH protease activity modulator HflK [Blautia sp.]|nr:FtsH protease activity modulator HflK [Lachnoclostridium sp.]MCM1210915.1 FtsH protease activity modulator HflK [Blautia sp.]